MYPYPLHFWCQKVLPAVYDESLSYYELLCKITDYINNIISDLKKLIGNVDQNTTDIDQIKQQIAELEQIIKDIADGKYMDVYIEALANWIDNNLQELVSKIVTYVSFGLSSDGYFVAYIPQNWNFLTFDTCMDTSSPLYGHLIMTW